MPGLDGMGVLEKIRDAGLNIPVIVQTAHGGIDNVVSAMRAGAHDFVVKPVGIERLQVSLRNALNASALKGELQRIRHSREGKLTFADIITRCAAMDSVLRMARKAATSTIPVLIEGESGVGKEMVARAIHGSGERSAKPFVAVNCGAIPDNLVESILFGHEKGAFTGATERHTGQIRRSLRRHAVSRRGRRTAARRPGQAAARAAGRRGRGGRRPQAGQGRRPHHLGDQPQAARSRQGRTVPRRPVLSPARAAADDPAAADAPRGHPASAAAFPGAILRRGKSADYRHQRRGDGASHGARMARQYSPARKRRLSRGGDERRRPARPRRFPAARRAARHRRRLHRISPANRSSLKRRRISPRRRWLPVMKYLLRRWSATGQSRHADRRRRGAAA